MRNNGIHLTFNEHHWGVGPDAQTALRNLRKYGGRHDARRNTRYLWIFPAESGAVWMDSLGRVLWENADIEESAIDKYVYKNGRRVRYEEVTA